MPHLLAAYDTAGTSALFALGILKIDMGSDAERASQASSNGSFSANGYFGIDSGLSKSWNLWERQTLKFAWEVFNVTNSVRFDTNPTSLGNGLATGSLGIYNSLLTPPRVQQFSLRFAF